MKKLIFAIVTVIAAGLVQTVLAETVLDPPSGFQRLPSSLSGSWHTEDNRFSKTWEVKVNLDGSGLVTWYSTTKGCDISAAPVKIEYDGSKLTITITESKYLVCFPRFVAELTRNGGSFEGKVWQGPPNGANKYAFALTSIK